MTAYGGFRARVGGLEFTGERFRWEPGYYVQSVSGLLSGSPVAPTALARPGGVGEYDLDNDLGSARVISLSGFVYARSLSDLGRMSRQLDGLLSARGDRGVFAWTEFSDWYHMTVKRGISSPTERRGNTGFADFMIRFRCSDATYYGGSHQAVGANVDAINRGNFPASPVVEVAGPRTAPYTITGPGGRVVTVTQSLSSGQTHRIDFASGAITRNGVRQKAAISHFQPWTIPAGSKVPMSISTGTMTVTVTDTFM